MSSSNDNSMITPRKTSSRRKSKTLSNRLNIPLPDEIHEELVTIARREEVSLAELARKVIESFLKEQRRQSRLSKLQTNAIEYQETLREVSSDWSVTEAENWPESAD